MSRRRYHELVGKTVVDADGARLGRVADLAARPEGDRLVITTLLVGPAAWLERVGFRRGVIFRVAPRRIPWALVDDIGDRIALRVCAAELPGDWQAAESDDGRTGP